MKESSVRIGDKIKSVRIKKYILDFYALMMGMKLEQAKERATEMVQDGLEMLLARDVTADYITKKLLVEVELETKES